MPARAPDDSELARAAAGGDRDALEQLLRRHERRLAVLCQRMCGPADAQDALQEALVAIVRGIDRFDCRSSFSTWAYRVATNASLDELRRRRRRPLPTEDVPEPSPGPAADDGAGDHDREELLVALAALPAEFRAPVVLRDVMDLDYAEIAEVLSLPPGTVRSRIARGRARLAERLSASSSGNPRRPAVVQPSGTDDGDPDPGRASRDLT